MFLSRLTLKITPSTRSLSALLDPAQRGEAMDAHHRVIWSAFTEASDQRDYLWRADGRGTFYTLSKHAPVESDFVDVQSRPFTPALSPGDRLTFLLRANAVRTVTYPDDLAPNGKPRRRKQDVVMHKMRSDDLDRSDRMDVAQTEGRHWLDRHGERAGFTVASSQVSSYGTVTIPAGRGRRRGQPHFGIMELTGSLEVADPDAFLPALSAGFGSAKAFGCGLMMIRRA